MRANRFRAGDPAGGTPAIPLRKATAGRGAEQNQFHTKRNGARDASPVSVRRDLEGRYVGGDFHGDRDDFGFGLGPGHGNILERRQKGLGFLTQSGNGFPDDALYSADLVPMVNLV